MNQREYLIPRESVRIKDDNFVTMWNDYKFGVPFDYSVFNEDFSKFDSTRWTLTVVGTGIAVVTQAKHGVLSVTTSGADNDNCNLQYEDTTNNLSNAFVRPTTGKLIFFETLYQSQSDSTQVDVAIGLAGTATTDIIGTPPSDGIYFRKDDGSQALNIVIIKSGVSTVVSNIATIAPSVYYTLGFKCIGLDSVEYYVDGNKKGVINTPLPTPSTCLTPTIAVQAGEGAIKRIFVDYIHVSQER